MEDNSNTHAESGLSFSRRSALALMGLGASTAVASCSDSGDTGNTATKATDTPNQPEGTTEDITPMEGHSLNEVLPGEKFGTVTVNEFSHTMQFSGTRESSWMVRPFNQDVQPGNRSYEDVGSGIQYGVIPFPPGKVPVLKLNGRINGADGVETSLRVSIANRPAFSMNGEPAPIKEEPVRDTIMDVSAIGSAQVYDEVYLTDVKDVVMGLDNGHELPSHTFLFEAKTDSPGRATIDSATTIALEMETL